MKYNPSNELGLDRKQAKKILSAFDDLNVKSMLFGMDIDLETASLVPFSKYKEPAWLSRWKDKESGKDYTTIDNGL